ncbi:MAG: DUF6132 family protein [Elusimicrobia bacterium]|nr:DUF6132 family protein [Candidatus Liberimonas magnetica]
MFIKILIAVIAGGVAGGIGGHFLKCAGGTCPLTCNPWGGAVFGIILAISFVLNLG